MIRPCGSEFTQQDFLQGCHKTTKVQEVHFLYEYTFEEEAEIDFAASLYGMRRLDAAFPKAALAATNTRAEAR